MSQDAITSSDAAQLGALYEEYLLEPCKSKAELNQWIQTFLGISFPNCTIDEHSNSNPLDFIWDVYSAVLTADRTRTSFVGAAGRACQKCLAEGTLVATPLGPVPIERLRVGDVVYDEYGKPVKVTAVHDQGMQECVDLMHHHTTLATCTPNHVWQCVTERQPQVWREFKTKDIYSGVRIRRVELNQPLGTVREPLAYALGALIGDGSCNESGIRLSSCDDLIPNKVAGILGTTAKKVNSNNYTYMILALNGKKKWEFSEFYEKHLRGKLAHTKEAPLEVIKTWDRESLIAFVAGLVDTDGSVWTSKNGKLLNIKLSMQCKDAVEAFMYALETIWQVPRAPLYVRSATGEDGNRRLKNGDLYICSLSSNYFVKKILKDLDPHLVSPQKKWKNKYKALESNNFHPAAFGIRKVPAGLKQCYDITVDSPTSLYCLQNGMVTHNTLSVSVLEFLLMLHFGKTIVHLAAILDQSLACIGYLDNFLSLPTVKKYSKTDSQRKKIIRGLPESHYRQSIPAALRVIVATQSSANGLRANCIFLDEVDLIDPAVISEAAMIADPDLLGRPPIFVYISSRKSAFGPVQDKIDAANDPKSGVKLHKWSLCDFMQKCPTEVHKPDEPMVNIHIHRDSLEIKSAEDFLAMPESMALAYDSRAVFAGCVQCPALLICQGRAVQQKSQPSRALRDVTFVQSVLRETKDPEKIKAQLMNLKPESSGNVFNRFDRAFNTGSIEKAWEFAFSVPWSGTQVLTKRFLREMLSANGWYVTCGVDFGYVDPAIGILVAHHRAFDKVIVIHTVKASGFSNPDWIQYCKERIFVPYGFDLMCPDTADKSSPTVAARLGMQCRSRKPHRIEAGVSWIQNHIWSPTKQNRSLFIIDDEANKPTIESLERYQYKRGALGFVFDTFDPDSPWSHEVDALRYACDPWVVYTSATMGAQQPKAGYHAPLYFEHQKAKEEALKSERKYLFAEIRDHYAKEHHLEIQPGQETQEDNEAEGSHSIYFSF